MILEAYQTECPILQRYLNDNGIIGISVWENDYTGKRLWNIAEVTTRCGTQGFRDDRKFKRKADAIAHAKKIAEKYNLPFTLSPAENEIWKM